jgi:hypothetical protein
MTTWAGKHQTVFSSADQARAESASQVLAEAGYHPLPVSPTRHPPVAGCRVLHRVDVPVEEMQAAREVLAHLGYEAEAHN